jgi:ABC-type lipoprotein export system ATPase subunit
VVELLAEEVHTREKAGILVTHDERLIDLCDRVVRIHDGKMDEIEDVDSAQGHILSSNGKTPAQEKREPSLIGKLLSR